MSVSGKNQQPFLPKNHLADKIIDDYRSKIKPEGKSKKAVDNLRSRIIDDYRAENVPVKNHAVSLSFNDSPELLPLSTKVSTSAAVIKPARSDLPLDVLKYIMRNLASKEYKATSLVSRFWGHASLEVAREKEIGSLKSFINFICEKVQNLKPETRSILIQLTENIKLSDLKSLSEVKGLLLNKRDQVLKCMQEITLSINKLHAGGEKVLELFNAEEKPLFFDDLIALSTINFLIELARQPKYAWKDECLKAATEVCCDMLDFKRAVEIANTMGRMKSSALQDISNRKSTAFKKLELKT